MRKKLSLTVVSLALVFLVLIGIGYFQKVSAKDKIVIGWARSFSGILAKQGETCFNPITEMWLDEINLKGGLYNRRVWKKTTD